MTIKNNLKIIPEVEEFIDAVYQDVQPLEKSEETIEWALLQKIENFCYKLSTSEIAHFSYLLRNNPSKILDKTIAVYEELNEKV